MAPGLAGPALAMAGIGRVNQGGKASLFHYLGFLPFDKQILFKKYQISLLVLKKNKLFQMRLSYLQC